MWGVPDLSDHFPGIDAIGPGTRIAEDVTVYRLPGDVVAVTVGAHTVLHRSVRLVVGDPGQHPATGLLIGDRVHVNVFAYLSGEGGLVIEDDVLIGPHARLLSAGHEIDDGEPVISRAPLTFGPVTVERGAWIGAGATVLQGVRVGAGAVVAAGSVVTRDVLPFSIVAGVPARLVRFREGFAPESAPARLAPRRWWSQLLDRFRGLR